MKNRDEHMPEGAHQIRVTRRQLLIAITAGGAALAAATIRGEQVSQQPAGVLARYPQPIEVSEWSTVAANPQRTSLTGEEIRGNLQPAWYRTIGPYVSQKIQIVAANNTLYVSTARGLYALDPDDPINPGRVKWIYPTDMPLGHSPTVTNGVAYVGCYDNRLHAVDANSGRGLWTFRAGAGFGTNPLVVNSTVYLGNRDGFFYAVDATSGQLKWSYQTGGPILYSAAYNSDLDTVYFASDDMHAYALNATTGALKWRSVKLPGDAFHSYWPVVHGNYVIFSGSASYRFSSAPYPGPLKRLDLLDLYPDRARNPKGTPLCATSTQNPLGTVSGQWATGTQTLDARCVTEYFETKPWRRSVFYLDQVTGKEYSFDSDGDGKPEYAPFLSSGCSASGNRYPPVLGSDGVAYQQNSYKSDQWIPGGNLTGWKPGTSILSLPAEKWVAVDEPLSVSVGGNILYWKLLGERAAGAIDLSAPQQKGWTYFESGGNQIKDRIPEVFLRDGKLWEFGYWKHGDQSPPVPYHGRLYMILNNAVVAFDAAGGAPRIGHIPVGKATGQPPTEVLKPITLVGPNVKVTASQTIWPTVIQQEVYYSTQSSPGARPRYVQCFEVKGSDTSAPTSVDVTQHPDSTSTMTSHFGKNDTLQAWVSTYTPTVLFANTGNAYSLLGGAVGAAFSSPSGIRVVEGSGTISSTAMNESWLLVWDKTDNHRWLPVLLSFQKRPSRIDLSPQGLRVTFPGQAGYASITPFYGMSDPRSTEMLTWKERLPQRTLERSRLLNRISKSFPVSTAEAMSIDPATGDVIFSCTHSFIDIQDDWNTPNLRIAYLPPELALAAWNGSPIKVNGLPLENHCDLEYPVPLGRIAGVANAREVTVTAPGIAKYWRNNFPPPALSQVAPKDPMLVKLISEVEKMLSAGHLRPGYGNTGIWQNYAQDRMGDFEVDYWHNPADTQYTLLTALPHLPADLQARVKTYLQSEFQAYPPYSVVHIGWDKGAAREAFDLPPEVDAARGNFVAKTSDNSALWGFPPQNFYALWLYAKTFGDAAGIFAKSKSRLTSPNFVVSTPYVLNSYISGYIGYLRLAELAGAPKQPAAEQTLVKMLIKRAALSKYPGSLAQTGFEYGGLKWAVNVYDTASGEILFKPAITGSLWDQLPLYGFPLTSLYFGGGASTGGDYTLTIDFLNLTPDLAQFLQDYAFKEASAAIDDYTDSRAPYWFVSRAEETGGEGAFQPLLDKWAYLQAKAKILEQPRAELEKYLDVPAFQVGDLFYIQNLVSILSAPANSSHEGRPTRRSTLSNPSSTFARRGIDSAINQTSNEDPQRRYLKRV